MKKNYVVIAVVLLLLVSGGVYFMKGKSSNKVTTPADQNVSDNSPKSLRDLLGLGKSQKCTFDKGTVYLSSGKVRGDFEGSHMIVDGNTNYIWMDNQKEGFKTIFDLNATTSTSASPDTKTNFDYNQKSDYKCESWTSDSTMFVVPTTITFQDMSKLTAPVKPDSSGNSAQCGYCNTLSGDDKTQCLKALSCK